MKRKTERGSWVFDEDIPTYDGAASVYESSIPAHICVAFRNGSAARPISTHSAMLDVLAAKRVAAALREFVRLTEAAKRPTGPTRKGPEL